PLDPPGGDLSQRLLGGGCQRLPPLFGVLLVPHPVPAAGQRPDSRPEHPPLGVHRHRPHTLGPEIDPDPRAHAQLTLDPAGKPGHALTTGPAVWASRSLEGAVRWWGVRKSRHALTTSRVV